MVKFCEISDEKTSVKIPPINTSRVDAPQMSGTSKPNPATSGVVVPPAATSPRPHSEPGSQGCPLQTDDNPIFTLRSSITCRSPTNIHVVGGRSLMDGYPPPPARASIIGQRSRIHFLLLLTSGSCWEETLWRPRQLFALDPDFHPKMVSVWSITVQSLGHKVSCSLYMSP